MMSDLEIKKMNSFAYTKVCDRIEQNRIWIAYYSLTVVVESVLAGNTFVW